MMLVTRFSLIGWVSRLHTIPDDNYFIEGMDLPFSSFRTTFCQRCHLVPPQSQEQSSSFDFGEEGDKLVEIVCDPLQFGATREAGNTGSDSLLGKGFSSW